MASGPEPVCGSNIHVGIDVLFDICNIIWRTFREEVQEFFNDMDRDFDERLTFEEFMGEESHIEKIFKSMDKNGDGFVTKEEFHNVCKNLTDDQVITRFIEAYFRMTPHFTQHLITQQYKIKLC